MSVQKKKIKELYGEPWSPATIFVDRVLEPDDVYVSNWTPKQIRFLAQVKSLISTAENYLGFKVPWLESLITEYMKLTKFEDGWVIKQAKDVARSSTTRMMMQVSRWRRILFGSEGEEIE